MAIYQQREPTDVTSSVEISGERTERSLPYSSFTSPVVYCPQPTAKPINPTYPHVMLQKDVGSAYLPDSAWLLSRTLVRSNNQNDTGNTLHQHDADADDQSPVSIPNWAAYNSLICSQMKKTKIASPPLIAAPANEWQTLLTVLMQAQQISAKVIGSGRKTVISLDLGLYKPAKQLQMSRTDMDNLILRPGELHIVMAQLRCIGAYVEGSGIDICWVESR